MPLNKPNQTKPNQIIVITIKYLQMNKNFTLNSPLEVNMPLNKANNLLLSIPM